METTLERRFLFFFLSYLNNADLASVCWIFALVSGHIRVYVR